MKNQVGKNKCPVYGRLRKVNPVSIFPYPLELTPPLPQASRLCLLSVSLPELHIAFPPVQFLLLA
jgi:hypothetical protein